MKKIFLLFCIISLIFLHGNAQTRGVFSLALGPAIPVGEYAGKSATDPSSGLAKIGAVADLSYQQAFGHSRFGWMATLRGRFNSVDKNATLAPFETSFPGYQWNINHGHWTTAAVLVGGFYQLPVTPKLSLSANIELGVADSWSPNQAITGVRDSAGFGPVDMVVANLHSVSATSFTGLAGLGVRYQWSSRLSFLARVDYAYLKPTFNSVNTTLAIGQGLVVREIVLLSNARSVAFYSETRNHTQAMPCVEAMVGVGWVW